MTSYTLVIFKCGRDQMVAAHEYDRLVTSIDKRVKAMPNKLDEHWFQFESASGSKGVLNVSEVASIYLVTDESQRRHWQMVKEINEEEEKFFSPPKEWEA